MTYPRRAPTQKKPMTRGYNLTMALSKIDIADLAKLTPDLLASIARTHKVPIGALEARLYARKVREGLA